jgi:DeoR family transcriptional regulator, aga operon transcriptional repressor
MKKGAAEDDAGEPRIEEPLQEGMMAEERRMQILQILRSEGRAKVNELVRRFNTSAVTIRSDLNELDQRGLVQRSHGGAVIQDTVFRESPVYERIKSQSKEKQRIGAMAATLVREGETIILDSGTTTLEVARHLKNIPNLQVITNGVNIAAELLSSRNTQIIMMGGTVRNDSASIVGRSTEDMLEQFSADKLFLCGAGCDPDFGVSGTNLEETMANRAMLRAAREIIVVADASKFGKRSMSLIASFSEVDMVISDVSLLPELQDRIRSFGCKLLLV